MIRPKWSGLLVRPTYIQVSRYSWQTYLRIPEKLKKSFQDPKKALPSPSKNPQLNPSDIETNMILGKALNMSAGNVLRCTVLDEKGRVKVVNGEFKRADLLTKYGLLPRDLRKVDKSSDNMVPTILVRENSILLCLLHIRALIKYNTVLLFETTLSSESQSLFLYELEHKLQLPSNLPYELRALEAILVSVLASLETERKMHEHIVNGILAEFETTIDRQKLRHLLMQSKQLSWFLQKVKLIRDELEQLTENDEDMADLYLTEKNKGTPLSSTDDHSSVEIMLESYLNQCDEIVQSAETLVSNIKNTEEIINIVLDANRNNLMLLELKFQIGMLGLSAGSVVSAVYGMNLKNYIEDTWWGFTTVSGFIGLVSIVVVAASLRKLAKVRKMHMGRGDRLEARYKNREHA